MTSTLLPPHSKPPSLTFSPALPAHPPLIIWQVFFDRKDLREISESQLKQDVRSSYVLVTVLDPATVTSPWVVMENETAYATAVPIQVLYDADNYRWTELRKWVEERVEITVFGAAERAKGRRPCYHDARRS